LDVINFILVGGGFALAAVSLGYLTIRDSRPGKPIGFLFYALAGFISVMMGYESGEWYLRYPLFLYINQPLELFLGPLAFWYLSTRIKGKISTALLFLPAIFGLIWFIPFFTQDSGVKLASVGFTHTPQPAHTVYLFVMYSAGPMLVLGLMLSVVYTYISLGKKSFAHLVRMRILIIHGLLWIGITALAYALTLFDSRRAFDTVFIAVDAALLFFYYLDARYSDFFDLIAKKIQEMRYRKSHTNGIDTHAVVARLGELMKYDKLYQDEEMSLNKMSIRLGITPHQLSEILNSELRMNFKSFINSYRIEEAKRKLVESKELNILDLAFACGFNSKTMFNTTFYKNVGKTPTEFRNGQKADESSEQKKTTLRHK
jgi:AraC-like DNA-binding protein